MKFIIDKQTQDDLNILGKYKSGSIFSLFNKVKTRGAEKMLQLMFQYPLTEPEQINKRSQLFEYVHQSAIKFPYQEHNFQLIEDYLSQENDAAYFIYFLKLFSDKVKGILLRDMVFERLSQGLTATVELIRTSNQFIQNAKDHQHTPFNEHIENFKTVLEHPGLQKLIAERRPQAFSMVQIATYDYLLRHSLKKEMKLLLETIFQLDLYTAVSEVGALNGFCYAESIKKEHNVLNIEALRHPALVNGVANPVEFGQNVNMMFLTGANMAGKSTFMKSFGIALYLGHMGFPVPAKSMQFSVRDGIFSSINMSDNLQMGHSHFYAEVLRVKDAAKSVSSGKSFVVLFDELFKGTNVKDAYDATLAVTMAFSKYSGSVFVISTHIIEVGEALQRSCDNVQFKYLPTIMEENVPKYTYQLQQGITSDRQGMLIIENEGILELLKD